MGATHQRGDPLVAVNATHEEIVEGEKAVLATLSTSDPVVNKILATLNDVSDTALAMGQRIFALEAEVNALRGELLTIGQQKQAPAPPPTGVRDFRPSHYSQIESRDGEELRRAILRWLEGPR